MDFNKLYTILSVVLTYCMFLTNVLITVVRSLIHYCSLIYSFRKQFYTNNKNNACDGRTLRTRTFHLVASDPSIPDLPV
uniref:Putative ORF7 protein n=1 Tax=Zaria bat coronavirus TaxID=989337 RepID=F1BYM4_9BETC|nr:putative ORF7 protein [Zaria bat coronavirus]